jgi:radical SAM superfamily enzyme YgiQ (UPF0313 family)
MEGSALALGVRNVAFYDDAFLFEAERHALPLLEALAARNLGLSFHLPNGIHARFVTAQVAAALRGAGVRTVRIGFETSDGELQQKTGGKTSNDEFREAVRVLREAGFTREETGAYILYGLPGQKAAEVERSIAFVHGAGAGPRLEAFSPIPGTPIWGEAVRSSPYPLEEEPLFHNKSVYVLGNRGFPANARDELKRMSLELRRGP